MLINYSAGIYPFFILWQDIFKEEVNRPEANNSYLNPADEWPSEDSEDEDYDPESNENSGEKIGGDESFSNDSSSSCSLFYSSDDAISYGESEHRIDADFVDLIVNTDTGEINSCETVSYRRQRRDVDYKKLHDVSIMCIIHACNIQL